MKNTAMFVALLTLTTIASAEEIGDEVARHYPAALSTFAQEFHLKERRQQAFVQIKSGQKRYVVAAYGNDALGAIVLMESTSEDALKVDQTILEGFGCGNQRKRHHHDTRGSCARRRDAGLGLGASADTTDVHVRSRSGSGHTQPERSEAADACL